MKNLSIFCLVICIFCLTTNAQTSMHTSGGTANGSGGSVTYSIGQIISTNINGSNGSASHGVQQPTEFFTLNVEGFLNTNLEITVYPNPTSESLQLIIKKLSFNNLSYYLYDAQGRTLRHQKINNQNTLITANTLPSAIYFLKISDNNRIIKTIKIIKK